MKLSTRQAAKMIMYRLQENAADLKRPAHNITRAMHDSGLNIPLTLADRNRMWAWFLSAEPDSKVLSRFTFVLDGYAGA